MAGIVGQKEIGIRIATKRQEMGMTLEQFSEKLEISRMTLIRIEHGETAPSLATLHLLFQECGITPNELFYERAEETAQEQILQMMRQMNEDGRRLFLDAMKAFARGIICAG